MDVGQQGSGPENLADDRQEDGAERAFEALHGEVAALRAGVELIYRQGQQAGQPAAVPGWDYSLTLGRMEKALRVISGRLEAVERQPVLQATGASLGLAIDRAAGQAPKTMTDPSLGLTSDLRKATATLGEVVGRVHKQRERQR